jgi:hypothetical protein
VDASFSILTYFVAGLLLTGCVTSFIRPEIQFSGVTREDVREIELLVAQRADILKPVISVNLLSTLPPHSPGDGKIEVMSGHDRSTGDTFDTFTVAKRHGKWRITSPIERERIIVTGE